MHHITSSKKNLKSWSSSTDFSAQIVSLHRLATTPQNLKSLYSLVVLVVVVILTINNNEHSSDSFPSPPPSQNSLLATIFLQQHRKAALKPKTSDFEGYRIQRVVCNHNSNRLRRRRTKKTTRVLGWPRRVSERLETEPLAY